MPYEELLVHLTAIGDEIATKGADELLTKNGHRYVRSREGTTFDGRAWWPKYIWVLW